MRTYSVKKHSSWLSILSLVLFAPLLAQDKAPEGKISGVTDEYFDGYTPMSPAVWNSFTQEPESQSQLRDYLFREAYLADANTDYLGREGKMFTIPTDDLSSTQRRLLSPYSRHEEEVARRNYAETVTGVVVNKGVPEYMLQLLGLQKLREGVKKIEKAVAVDVVIGTPSPNLRHAKPWKFKTALLPMQRSLKVGIGNTILNWEVQGGYTANKGDMLYSTLSARWGRFLQSNTYQAVTSVGYSTLSFFISPDMSVSTSIRNEFKDDKDTPDTLTESVGFAYIF